MTLFSDASQLAWFKRLVQATTPAEVDELVVDMARCLPDGMSARLIRTPDAADAAHALDATAMTLLREGLDDWCSEDGRRVALRFDTQSPAMLLLDFHAGQDVAALAESLRPALQLAEQHLRQVRMVAELHDSHRQLARSANLQSALFAISELAGSDLDMPDMLRSLHDIMRTLMYAENFFIVRCDQARGTMQFLYYADTVDSEDLATGEETPLERWRNSLTWHLIVHGQPLRGNAEELSRQIGRPLEAIGPDSLDWLGVPMLREGVAQGVLVVQSYLHGIHFTSEDEALLAFVASHILTALERKQTKRELEQRVRERTRELAELNRGLELEIQERQRAVRLQEALFHLAQLATVDIDEDSFYERVHAAVGQLLDAENFSIALLSQDQQNLVLPYYFDRGIKHRLTRPVDKGLSEFVLRRGEAWLGTRKDIDELHRSGEVVPRRVGEPAASWLGVPMRVDDQTIGLVAVQNYADDVSYSQADKELLGFAALQIASSIYRRRSAAALQKANVQLEQRVEERTRELRAEIARREQIQQQLRHQTLHDPLTGLPNRSYLRDRLEQLLPLLHSDPGYRCALLYIDVDRFKMINDSLGHLAGDAFLKAVAERLCSCVREPDVVARLSGDEFAILLEKIDTPCDVEAVAQRVLQAMSGPLHIDGNETEPSISLGIAMGDSRYGNADDLVRAADTALYRAKELGRKRYVLFDETLASNTRDTFTLESELRRALQRDEFEPYFQPIRRLADDGIVGYEALLRWNHPRRGVLRPNDFLRVAQETGRLESIDWRLFKRACQFFKPLAGDGCYLTVNVSPGHLHNADFDRRLLALLERTGFLSYARLVVELTEGALLDDASTVRENLSRLHDAGVDAALDDFGTGYSSLNHLHTLPLRKLKIDQSFVQSLDDAAASNSRVVVAAILALGRALDLAVIAEGIETPTQRQVLLEMGCEFGQGYLLGRPAPAAGWRGA